MLFVSDEIKRDPARRWRLSERVFFGHGGCHILAGVFLRRMPELGWYALWQRPMHQLPGSHVFVTDGAQVFDYHGLCSLERTQRWHRRGWRSRYAHWEAQWQVVDFDLLDTAELNARGFEARISSR